jgi:hypothetical protein
MTGVNNDKPPHATEAAAGVRLAFLTGGSYSVRDEATGPQEDGPVTDNGTCNIDNGRFSIRPPHAVYYRNSFFWTTSFFSDNFKLLPHRRVVNNKEWEKCFSPQRPLRCT